MNSNLCTPLMLAGLLAILLSIYIFSFIKRMYVYFSNVNITIYVVNNDFSDNIHVYILLKKADFIYILTAFTMCNNKHQKPMKYVGDGVLSLLYLT